jgi:hypothetical protein
MKATFFRFVCRILAVSLVVLPLQAQAGMIGTGDVAAAAQSQSARRAVESQLQSLGVAPQEASARVAALTDAQVADLSSRIDNLPAGGNGLLAIIVVALLIYYLIVVPSKEAPAAKK